MNTEGLQAITSAYFPRYCGEIVEPLLRDMQALENKLIADFVDEFPKDSSAAEIAELIRNLKTVYQTTLTIHDWYAAACSQTSAGF